MYVDVLVLFIAVADHLQQTTQTISVKLS